MHPGVLRTYSYRIHKVFIESGTKILTHIGPHLSSFFCNQTELQIHVAFLNVVGFHDVWIKKKHTHTRKKTTTTLWRVMSYPVTAHIRSGL